MKEVVTLLLFAEVFGSKINAIYIIGLGLPVMGWTL